MNKSPLNPTRRRWFRFSLRTLFVAVTVICIYLGWAMNWVRQRHEVLATETKYTRRVIGEDGIAVHRTAAPFPLRLLGELGISDLTIVGVTEKELDWIAALFPESNIQCLLQKDGLSEWVRRGPEE